jgi:hypothetical protein
MGVYIEYCGVFWVSSCDFSQGVKRVKVIHWPSVSQSIYHRVNNLKLIYTLGNVTRQYPEYTTLLDVYTQFSSHHTCTQETPNIG